MKMKLHIASIPSLAMTFLFLPVTSSQAQTAPPPETTFTTNTATSGNYLWSTAANWNNGLPSNTVDDSAMDDALIADGQTAYYRASVEGGVDSPPFGTLTLGTNATMQYYPDNGGDQGQFGPGKSIYFNNASHLEYVSGANNTDHNFYIIPGATATYTPGSGGKPRGTLNGSGNLNIVLKGNAEVRWTASSHSGNTEWSSDAAATRGIDFGSFGGTTQLGPAVATFKDRVYLWLDNSDRIHNSATIKLIGSVGNSNPKLKLSDARSDTIANMVVESPGTLTGSSPLLITGGLTNPGRITVTDTVTFQGTAGTIELIDAASNASRPNNSGVLRTASLTFTGTGSWTVLGTGPFTRKGEIVLTGTNITANVDAVISNTFTAANGFIKAGSGTLTLGNPSGVAKEIKLSEGGVVFDATATFTASDYVTFEVQDTLFGADFGGSFADIAAVNAAIGETGSFRKFGGVAGNLKATDNGDGTFTVVLGPPGGTIFLFQ